MLSYPRTSFLIKTIGPIVQQLIGPGIISYECLIFARPDLNADCGHLIIYKIQLSLKADSPKFLECNVKGIASAVTTAQNSLPVLASAIAGYITSTISRNLQANFIFSRYIHAHPFKWNNSTKAPEVLQSPSGLKFWLFNVILGWLHDLFLQTQAIQVEVNPDSLSIEWLYMQIMTFYYATSSLAQAAYINGGFYEVAKFLQNYMRLLKERLEQEVDPSRAKKMSKLVSLVLTMFQGSFQFNCILVVIAGLLKPSSPQLLSSLMPNADKLSWSIRLVFGAVESNILICYLESWLLLFCYFIFVISTTIDMLKIFR